MHKPARPKSAKGKTRAARPIVQRNVAQRQENGTLFRTSSSTLNASGQSSKRGTITGSYSSHPSNIALSSTSSTSRINSVEKEPDQPSAPYFPEITRPTSSLSRYHILPSISNSPTSGGDTLLGLYTEKQNNHAHFNDVDLLTEQAQQMILDSSVQQQKSTKLPSPPPSAKRKVFKVDGSGENKRQKMYKTQSVFAPLRKPLVKEPPTPRVPREPGPEEDRLLLALKLPDGSRIERHFRPNTKLINVLAFTHSQFPVLPISQCNLYRMDVVPKMLLSQTDLTLQQAGIQHRTVLYVEERDDDDN